MFKRVTIVALVVAAFLVLAVPAMAWNGYREDYTTSGACETCHSGIAGIPAVYSEWAETKHAEAGADNQATRLPYGSVCQGCHTSNFDPSKVVPSPSGTAWVAGNGIPTQPQAQGSAASSENYVGCSSCHYGANVSGDLAASGVDKNDTAHQAPFGDMANADICGACHSRYSYTVDTYSVSPIPVATQTTLIQPQMAIGYPMLGSPAASPAAGWDPAAPLDEYLTIPAPGWTPQPNPAATAAGYGKLMTYWQIEGAVNGVGTPAGTDTVWQQIGHDGSAAQYPEWRSEGHAASLTALTSMPFWSSFSYDQKAECLECHSADYRIMKEAGKLETPKQQAAFTPKYGITCQGCHAPHDSGDITGAWDEEFDAQLVDNDALNGNGSNLCTECHNGEIPAGSTASPGAEIHHPMKEMMDGYGAIDVARFPSVHKGKCIQCHMAPTSFSRGAVQLGGNHTFKIIEPVVAAEEVVPVPVATTTTLATELPIPNATVATQTAKVTKTVSTVYSRMPYSACSTCHDNNPQPETVISGTAATSRATATPSPNYEVVTTTITRQTMAASGDKGMWLQDTIDQRQEWTLDKIAEIHDALNAAAVRLGYVDEADAHEAIVAKAAADRTESETNFLKAFTNVQYVESEGSYGLHNWDYSRQIVNTAMWQAESVEAQPAPAPWSITFKASKTSVKKNTKVKFSGTVAPADALAFGHATVTIQKYSSGTWKKWKTVNCNVAGGYSISVKMTAKGTFKLRALMPAFNANNMTQGVSPQVSVKVK